MKKLFFILLIINYIIKTESLAEQTLKTLSLDEKIGQLFIARVNYADSETENLDGVQNRIIKGSQRFPERATPEYVKELIKNYHIGGIHFTLYGTIQSCLNAIKEFQDISNLPLFISQDFEWGLSMRLLDAMRFPKNMTLGAIQDNNLIYEMGKEIGKQCKLLGVNINFAPVADVNNNPKNPVINDRSFGEDKENIAQKSIAFMQGLLDANIIACAKHFPGHGDTEVDSHCDLPIINHPLERLNDIELYPFKKLIEAGIPMIMTAHLCIPALDARKNRAATLSKSIITNLLRNELKFDGLIVTDGLDMSALTKHFEPGIVDFEAFLAGNDILLMSEDIPRALNLIKQAIQNNIISEEELDKRVLRILKAKEKLGLNKQRYLNNIKKEDFFTTEAKDLKKKLYETAIILVANTKNILPLNAGDQIIYMQISGQKNIEFKNKLNSTYKDIEILQLDKNISEQEIQKITKLSGKTIIISIFDMNKFASKNYGISNKTLELINELNKKNNVILILFGNAYSLKFFKNIPTIIMAYEDDIDAQNAAANIISGKLKPSGSLPVSSF